jgi:hypothetical protein
VNLPGNFVARIASNSDGKFEKISIGPICLSSCSDNSDSKYEKVFIGFNCLNSSQVVCLHVRTSKIYKNVFTSTTLIINNLNNKLLKIRVLGWQGLMGVIRLFSK